MVNTVKIKQFLKKEWLPLTLIALSFIAGWYFHPKLPDMVPMHWNFAGEVDDYGPKLMVTLGFPAIALAMYIMMLVLPFIDPKRKNYNLFEGSYFLIRTIILFFFIFMFGVIVTAGLGYNLDVSKVVVFAVGLLFIVLGNYMGRVRQNFFVGIKTPWTLSNNEVWTKTHRAAAKVWVLGGLLMMASIFINSILTFIVILAAAFFPIVYSYILYVKLDKNA